MFLKRSGTKSVVDVIVDMRACPLSLTVLCYVTFGKVQWSFGHSRRTE